MLRLETFSAARSRMETVFAARNPPMSRGYFLDCPKSASPPRYIKLPSYAHLVMRSPAMHILYPLQSRHFPVYLYNMTQVRASRWQVTGNKLPRQSTGAVLSLWRLGFVLSTRLTRAYSTFYFGNSAWGRPPRAG